MTAGDMLLMMVKTRSELANRWCVITVEQAEALADLVESGTVDADPSPIFRDWRKCLYCENEWREDWDNGSGALAFHAVDCPLAAVERVFKGDDHASE